MKRSCNQTYFPPLAAMLILRGLPSSKINVANGRLRLIVRQSRAERGFVGQLALSDNKPRRGAQSAPRLGFRKFVGQILSLDQGTNLLFLGFDTGGQLKLHHSPG
jgi:hypothetical protein